MYPKYKKIKLRAIQFERVKQRYGLCGLQLLFTGDKKTLFLGAGKSECETVEVDTQKIIDSVAIKTSGEFITGFRMSSHKKSLCAKTGVIRFQSKVAGKSRR